MARQAIVDMKTLETAEEQLNVVRRRSRETLADLRRSREHLALTQRLGHLGSVEVDLRTDRVYWSEELYRLYDLDPMTSAPPGRDVVVNATHPDDRQRVIDFADALHRGQSPAPMENRIVLRDGSVRWIRRTAEVVADEHGVPAQLLIINQDITERRLFEAQIKTERDLAQRYLDVAAVMILVVDPDGTVALINRKGCDILEYDNPGDVIGKPWIEQFIPEHSRDEVRDLHRRFHTGEDPGLATHENTVLTRSGRERIIAWRNRVLFDSQGQPVATLSSGEDITERKRMEEQLRQAQKMEAIGTLTGGMAHDFNNGLGVIIGNLELLQQSVVGNPNAGELCEEALAGALRCADLIRRLLAFARRQPLRPAQINVNSLVADTVRLLHRLLGEDIEIVLRTGEGIWPIMADPAQLEACLANLATNARDAMPKGGRLTITTANCHLDAGDVAANPDASEGDFVRIEVSDTGIGMSARTIAKIFDPFFTTKEPGKGTGLGLSMVFGFLQQSRGHVSVSSEQDAGSCFRLYFPRLATPVSAQSRAAAPAAVPAAGETVLVVEDNPAMRSVVRRRLRALGYRVIECEKAVAALETLECEPVDLMLTDIVMPGGIDGFGLARLARERWPDLKVVLTSGFPFIGPDAESRLPADTRLLCKPYSRDELAAVLRTALNN